MKMVGSWIEGRQFAGEHLLGSSPTKDGTSYAHKVTHIFREIRIDQIRLDWIESGQCAGEHLLRSTMIQSHEYRFTASLRSKWIGKTVFDPFPNPPEPPCIMQGSEKNSLSWEFIHKIFWLYQHDIKHISFRPVMNKSSPEENTKRLDFLKLQQIHEYVVGKGDIF